jgi:4-amino-4-deoxy-L-arabinose transferase-like glycosyltransferase
MVKIRTVHLGLLIIFVTSFLLANSPIFQTIPGRDSGVFLYIGKTVLEGGQPYKDVWDHKPPLIYFINALGLLIAANGRWGVWILETFAMLWAVFLSYWTLQKVTSHLAAFLCTFAWISLLPILFEGGNLTEEFALPLQFGILFLFCFLSQNEPWGIFLIGLFTSLCFLLKTNLVVLGITSIVILLAASLRDKKNNKFLVSIFLALLGISIPICFFLVYFTMGHSLKFFWECFLYNFSYISNIGLFQRIFTGLSFLWIFSWTGLFPLLFIMMLQFALDSKKSYIGLKNRAKILICLSLPLEFIAVSLSGRLYKHYGLALIPTIAFGAAFGLSLVMDYIKQYDRKRFITFAFVGLLITLFCGQLIYGTLEQVKEFRQWGSSAVVEAILNRTIQKDTVLVWGNDVEYNFFTNRQSPSRYAYQIALSQCHYAKQALAEELYNDIISKSPKVIIDASDTTAGLVPSLIDDSSLTQCEELEITLSDIKTFIRQNYSIEMDIPTSQGHIYILLTRPLLLTQGE